MFICGPRRANGRVLARRQAQANADASGVHWAYGTDTNGNWCCCRSSEMPTHIEPAWEVVPPDEATADLPRYGDLGTIPFGGVPLPRPNEKPETKEDE